MVGFRLERFGGSVPILSKRLLPENMAAHVLNADLKSGEIAAIRQPKLLADLGLGPQYAKAIRLPPVAERPYGVWYPLASIYGTINRSPITNDTHDRFIVMDFNSPGAPIRPMQTTLARILSGTPPHRLGLTRPMQAPTVTVNGGSGTQETRSYVYTYVNAYGEESQPSDPVVVNGYPNGTWTVANMANPASDSDENVTSKRLYRTVPGSGSAAFFRVKDFAVTQTSVVDDAVASSVVQMGLILQSSTWAAPEALEGLVPMAGGFFAGWRGRDIMFSEPYRPWAWPAEYTISVEHKIVGCGVQGQTLIVLTESSPVMVTGARPEYMSISKTGVIEPCVAATSIVSTPDGVYFAGRNGLMLANADALLPLTRQVVAQEDWRLNFIPRLTSAAMTDGRYLAFKDDGTGFIFDPSSTNASFVPLNDFPRVRSVWSDPWTGETHFMVDNGVYLWGDPASPPAVATWRSKEFVVPKPLNFGAISFTMNGQPVDAHPSGHGLIMPDAQRFGGPWTQKVNIPNYNIINGSGINTGPAMGTKPPGLEDDPLAKAWPEWFGITFTPNRFQIPDGVNTYAIVYANGRAVWQAEVQSDKVYRLPSGFKADYWQVEVQTRVPVMSVQIAETGKELALV